MKSNWNSIGRACVWRFGRNEMQLKIYQACLSAFLLLQAIVDGPSFCGLFFVWRKKTDWKTYTNFKRPPSGRGLIPFGMLLSEGSVTSQTPVRNKQNSRSICLLMPEYLARSNTQTQVWPLGKTYKEPINNPTFLLVLYRFSLMVLMEFKGRTINDCGGRGGGSGKDFPFNFFFRGCSRLNFFSDVWLVGFFFLFFAATSPQSLIVRLSAY